MIKETLEQHATVIRVERAPKRAHRPHQRGRNDLRYDWTVIADGLTSLRAHFSALDLVVVEAETAPGRKHPTVYRLVEAKTGSFAATRTELQDLIRHGIMAWMIEPSVAFQRVMAGDTIGIEAMSGNVYDVRFFGFGSFKAHSHQVFLLEPALIVYSVGTVQESYEDEVRPDIDEAEIAGPVDLTGMDEHEPYHYPTVGTRYPPFSDPALLDKRADDPDDVTMYLGDDA